MMNDSEICFVGIGNEFRSDDGAGIVAIRRLDEKYSDRSRFYYFQEDIFSIIPLLEKFRKIVLVDAVMTGSPPGTVHELNLLSSTPSISDMKFSGHLVNIIDAIRMAKELYGLHPEIHFFGIEGRVFEFGTVMMEAVMNAVDEVVRRTSSRYFGGV